MNAWQDACARVPPCARHRGAGLTRCAVRSGIHEASATRAVERAGS